MKKAGKKNAMQAYTVKPFRTTGISRNVSVPGETMMQKMERIINNKEPIKDAAPLIYTEKKDGVVAGHNIRTDRFEMALDAIEKVNKTAQARRDAKAESAKQEAEKKAEMKVIKPDGGAEPTQGQSTN